MSRFANLTVAGVLALGGIAAIGCHHDHGPDAEFYAVPSGYSYGPAYYESGYYDGDYWTWRDRDGRWYREHRDFHERRLHDRGHEEHEEHEEHDRR